MRTAVDPHQKHQSFGISFPPTLRKAAQRRAHNLELPLSKYLQRLVEDDIRGSASKANNRSTRPAAEQGHNKKGGRHEMS